MSPDPNTIARTCRPPVLLGIAIGLYCLYAGFSIPTTQDWGDDFALYLHHARNIVEGKPYADLITDRSFPPGLPILLAGWSLLFGWDLASFKLIPVLFLAPFAAGSYLLARRYLTPWAALAVAIFTLISPAVLRFSLDIATDIPFSALAIFALLAWDRYLKEARADNAMWQGLEAVLWSFAALLMRPAGGPLILAGMAALAVAWRRAPNPTSPQALQRLGLPALLLGGAILLYYGPMGHFSAQFTGNAIKTYQLNAETNPTTGPLDIAAARIDAEAGNLRDIIFFKPNLWGKSVNQSWRAFYRSAFFRYAVSAFLLIGYILALRRFQLFELYTAGAIGVIVATPWAAGVRYYVPLLPFLFIYAGLSVRWLTERCWLRSRPVLRWASLLLLIAVIRYDIHRGRDVITIEDFRDEIGQPSAQDILNHVRNLPHDGLICGYKPAAIMYYARQRACFLWPWDRAALQKQGTAPWMRDHGVTILFLPIEPSDDDRGTEDQDFATLGAKSLNDSTLKIIYRNEDFALFALRP